MSNGGAAYTEAAPAPVSVAPPAAALPAAPAPPGATVTLPAVTGGQVYGAVAPAVPPVVVPGVVAKILPNGYAAAPAGAPPRSRRRSSRPTRSSAGPTCTAAAIRRSPSVGYDCSGTVSFALHGGDLLATPMDSSDFMRWGVSGHGQWITIFSNPGHVYMTVAGIRLDTSTAGDPSRLPGPRWRPVLRSNRGFKVRMIAGL